MKIASVLVFLLATACSALGNTENLAVYVTRPISDVMILPDTDPGALPGGLSDTVTVVAALGEYEPASIVVRPDRDIVGLELTVTELAGEDGAVIPAANVDIKSVKCWYQAKGAWKTLVRMSYRQVLVPELLLNDDTLVKTDHETGQNYLRLTYDTGDRYILFDWKAPLEGLEPHNREIYWSAEGIGPLAEEKFTFKDSPALLPVDLPGGRNKQFWITVHVPPDASPGEYSGHMALSSDSRILRRLNLQLTVLPFALVTPKTYFDPHRHFTSSIYYRGVLDPAGRGAVFGACLPNGEFQDLKSRQQMKAELDNLYRHGVTEPNFCVPYSVVAGDMQRFRDVLEIRQEAGITGPYYMVFDVLLDQQDEAALKGMQERAKELMAIAEEFDIPAFYFYAIDESSGELLRRQRPAWEAMHEIGGKVCVAGYRDSFEAVGDLLDLLICHGAPDRALARKWHSVGHRIWCYANPQGGIENPLRYRRNYGFLLWKAEYDGAATYCYQTENGSWNDRNDIMRDHTFAYPTSDGVVDTIAWEGYREGIDDIRYGSTLRLAIEKARAGQDDTRRRIAGEAMHFLEGLDPQMDLDATRSKVIRYILELAPHPSSMATEVRVGELTRPGAQN